MFNPSLCGIDSPGIASMINESLSKCDIDTVLPLVQNIMVTGGTTMFAGLANRIDKELRLELTKTRYKGNPEPVKKIGLNVHDPPRRKHAVFIGGSFLAGHLPKEQWISKAEFEAQGAKCLHLH
jgi:actin-related protein 2